MSYISIKPFVFVFSSLLQHCITSLAALQRAQVRIPAPSWQLTTSGTPVPWNLTPSSDLYGIQAIMWYKDIYADKTPKTKQWTKITTTRDFRHFWVIPDRLLIKDWHTENRGYRDLHCLFCSVFSQSALVPSTGGKRSVLPQVYVLSWSSQRLNGKFWC